MIVTPDRRSDVDGAFRIAPDFDADHWRRKFARDGRVRITSFLADDDAERLSHHLETRTEWRQVINHGDRLIELDREQQRRLTATQRAALETVVMDGARSGFQYRYETIRVPDSGRARNAARDPLANFAEWLSGDAQRALLRRITGADDMMFVDMQATLYRPGDLLTAHDDAVPGKDRRAAYVFGLTPLWRPEWGGLLLFHDRPGEVQGVVPGFNTLDLFAVPTPHSVSTIGTMAARERLSVTGWLRAQPQPD